MSSKSTFSNSTSKSYALALYELSKENSDLDKVEDEMKKLNKRYRCRILIKYPRNFFIQKYLSQTLNKIKIVPGIKLEVDVDPINFS